MKKVTTVLLVLLFAPWLSSGQSATAEEPIRKIASDWDEAWNRGDASGVANLLSENVDFVSRSGFHVVGRAGFARVLGRLFEGRYQGSKRSTSSAVVAFVTPEVALLRVNWTLTTKQGSEANLVAPERGTLHLVVAMVDGRWSVVAGQNTNVPDAAN
jgi:uncharacterized protein (TIGR02246 family)